MTRMRKLLLLLLAGVVAGAMLTACGGDGDDDTGTGAATQATDDTAEDAGDDTGDGDDAGDDGTGDDGADAASTPEEIATEAKVPVPDGYSLTAAEKDGDTTKVDLAYSGGPDVPGYQAQMEAEGWAIDSVTPINSFCIRAQRGASFAEVAYLQTGMVLWTITNGFGTDMCPRRDGL